MHKIHSKQTDHLGREIKYSYGPYNKYNKTEQWIRLSEGCPNNCPFCYEPQEYRVFPIPDIVRNSVKIMDMNLLCKPEALDILKELAIKKVNDKNVYYELICGIDYRYLTMEMAYWLKKGHHRKIRLAWDFGFGLQYKIKDTIEMLKMVGYNPKQLMVFMICNWKIKYKTNLQKLDLLKVWNVQVADCYYDNQVSPNIVPIYWTKEEIKSFRKKCRKHNQLVNFKCDPEYKETADAS